MELDITYKSKSKIDQPKKLSKKESQRQKEKGLCYEYGLPGYMASFHCKQEKRQINIINQREILVINRRELIKLTIKKLKHKRIHPQIEPNKNNSYKLIG